MARTDVEALPNLYGAVSPVGADEDPVVYLHYMGYAARRIDDLLGLEEGSARRRMAGWWRGQSR